ncbi:MAG TPA: LemA family protein, partial [Candidatus Thermoplasmatota archaeon]|nr:LemA family protein [Candidatus Thermoplasmatota archaeon]
MEWWIWLLIVLGVVAVVLIFVGYYNRIVQLENQVENAWGQIDVQLQRRADLVPNLVETVKGYAKHEKEVLENVTRARPANPALRAEKLLIYKVEEMAIAAGIS